MITTEKIAIYKKYNGDIDGWVRAGTKNETAVMFDQDWYDIDVLLQRFRIEKAGRASGAFQARTAELIAEQVDGPHVARLLKEYA